MSQTALHSHYYGEYASEYEKFREQQPHWHTEHAAVVELLSNFRDAKVLDCPVGTGRFLPLYKQLGCSLIGADISTDMLAESRRKAESIGYPNVELINANASDSDFGSSVDVAISVRFLNLIPNHVAEKSIRNLARATGKAMILHVTTINLDDVPESKKIAIETHITEAYSRQGKEMGFASHRMSDFIDWCARAEFKIERSIECQERHGYSRTHMHLLVRG